MSSAAAPIAVLQARMSSSRLPGKTLADVGGEPMLGLMLRRLAAARSLREIVVATSTEAIDDPVAGFAARLGVGTARGPRDDVLTRFVLAVGEHRGPVVRLTADCPLIDAALLDATLDRFLATPGCVYASNLAPRMFPDGLDVEVVDADVLRAVASEDLSPAQREHVTLAIREQPDRFPAVALVGREDLGSLRWSVDEAADLQFVRAVVARLDDRRHAAGMEEILTAVRCAPSLAGFGGVRRG